MYYKVIVECGHLGAANGVEITRFIKNSDLTGVLQKLRSMPRVKNKSTLKSLKLLKEITEDEYRKGIRGFKRSYGNSPYFTRG